MQNEMMPTDRLVPCIRNAQTHSADPMAQIAASIAEFGFTNPIMVGADRVILAGQNPTLVWLPPAVGIPFSCFGLTRQ